MKIQLKLVVMLTLAVSLAIAGCSDGSGSNEADSPLIPSTIVFADGTTVSRQLGSGTYTNAVSGDGEGAIEYTSETPETVTVDSATGEVTLVATGTTVITAVKAATAAHETVTNTYTLTVRIEYAIGDIGPSGIGIVFYTTNGGLNGLAAAPALWDGGADPEEQWKTSNTSTSGTSSAIGTGSANTDSMAGAEHPAAEACRTYSGGELTDWFLPSLNELNELYLQKDDVGGFDGAYWSSTDAGSEWADIEVFANGGQFSDNKTQTYKVRPIRSF
jgi:hypothetical protein